MAALPSIDELLAGIPPGPPLDQLSAASELAGRLRARGDELLDHFVAGARASGASWSEIGGSLGTSKQAAQQRFAVLAHPVADQTASGLSGPVVELLDAAAGHARDLGHHYVRPEHLIMALVERPDELGGQVLAELGVNAGAVRAEVERRLGVGAPREDGWIGVAPQTKRVLELAQSTAKLLGHRCPRSEHVLLAATSPKLDTPAAAVLAECGAEPEAIRAELTRTLLREAPELADRMRSRSLLSRVRRRSL